MHRGCAEMPYYRVLGIVGHALTTFKCTWELVSAVLNALIVTVCLLSHGIFLLSFLRHTHLLFGMCSYDWTHCLILLSTLNSSLIEL